ncbi:MAG TPA: phosphatase PAP2 family protein [Thermodesulfobacteriota bacterium]|nr:phosphatase PAP2 family protein [Thermodesulfobacteriota bacterium]
MPTCCGLKRSHLMILFAVTFILFAVTGCGTLSNGRGWGEDAIFPVDLKKIPRAALNALEDPQTFLPAAGALVFGLSKWDKKVSHWATDHTPIFGSTTNASNDALYFEIPLYTEVFITAVVTPSGDDSKDWVYSTLKGMVVEGAAELVTAGMTSLLKDATGRTRPNGSGNASFPSGEASAAFSSVALSNRNLDSIEIPQEVKIPLKVVNILLGSTVAWARVEAQAHYPSDVLAGAALGNFLSATVHDSFLNLPKDKTYGFSIFPTKGGVTAGLYFTLHPSAVNQSRFIYRSSMANDPNH